MVLCHSYLKTFFTANTSGVISTHILIIINNKISRLAKKFFDSLLFLIVTPKPVYLTLTSVGALILNLKSLICISGGLSYKCAQL